MGKKENLLGILAGLAGLGALIYFWPRANAENCPVGYHKDPVSGECVPDPIQCQAGYHYDPVTHSCVPDTTSDPPYPGQAIIHVTPVLTDTVPKVIVNIRNWLREPQLWDWGIEHPFGVNRKGTDRDSGQVVDANSINYEIRFPTSDDEDSNHFQITATTINRSSGIPHVYVEQGFIHITGQRPNWNIVYQKGISPG